MKTTGSIRKLLALLLVGALLCTLVPFAAAADATNETAFTFVYLPDGTQTPSAGTKGVRIKGLQHGITVQDLVIPETINGYPVTEIVGLSDRDDIETVHIPSGVTSIDTTFSFRRCPNLREFTVAARNTKYFAEDGILMDGSSIHTYPAGKTDAAYTLPSYCTAILSGAFCCNPYLQKLTAPADVLSLMLHIDAISGCTALTEIVELTPTVVYEFCAVSECPQNIRLHLQPDSDVPYRKEDLFENCGTVTICTAAAFDDYWSTYAALYGYAYCVCGSEHETYAFDPSNPVTITETDLIDYSLNTKTVDGVSVVTGVTVTGKKNPSQTAYDLIVPETIEGYPVTTVNINSDDALTHLSVPATVTGLVLLGNANLTAIDIDADNETYRSVDGVAFSKNGKTLVAYPSAKTRGRYTVPEGTETIADYAFKEARLRELSLPASLKSMYAYLQTGRMFASFRVDENNTVYSAADGVLYSKDKTVLRQYPRGKTGTAFTVPASVTLVERSAFSNNLCLQRVAIAEGVTSTPVWNMEYMPMSYTGVTRVHVPSSVQTVLLGKTDGLEMCVDALPCAAANFAVQSRMPLYLCDEAHTTETPISSNDPRLNPSTDVGFVCNSVYADDNKEIIGLRVVDLTNVPDEFFTIDIPSSIGGYPVLEVDLTNRYRYLRGVAIPATVRNIAPNNWLYCYNLNSIVVDKDNPYYCDINGVLFTADRKELVIYPHARVADNYYIPEGTERITSMYTFAFCTGVGTLHLPASLTELPNRFLFFDSHIRRIAADENNPAFCTDELGVLYTKDMCTMIACLVRNLGVDTYTVPASVTSVGNAFQMYYANADVNAGAYYPLSSGNVRTLIFEDGMTSLPSGMYPRNLTNSSRNIRTLHIPSSVTQINEDDLHYLTTSFLICSDSATGAAAQFAAQHNIPFAVCAGGVHNAFAMRLTDEVGSPSKQYIPARVGQPIGTLPTPKAPSGSLFLGWYCGDTPVTADTVVTDTDMELWASWNDSAHTSVQYRLDPPAKRTYNVGEMFDPDGMTIWKRVDGGEWELYADSGFVCTPEILTATGTQSVTVTYGSFTGAVEVNVTDHIYEYKLKQPTRTLYDVGDTFDPTGMTLYRRTDGGEWEMYATSGFVCTPTELTHAGVNTVTVSYGDFIGNVTVYVTDTVYEYKLVPPERLTYSLGSTFDATGMRILRRVGGKWEEYGDGSFFISPSVLDGQTGLRDVIVSRGKFSGTVQVFVTEAGKEYSLMPPIKTNYVVGDTFDPIGLRLLYRENDGDWQIITEEGFTCTPSVFTDAGTQPIHVAYGDFIGTVYVDVTEQAFEYRLDPPTKTTYRVGEAFDPTGMQLLRRVDGGAWTVYATDGFTCSPSTLWNLGTQTVAVEYGTFSGTVEVTVQPAEYTYMLTPPTKTTYRVGEEFNPAGMQLLRRMNDGDWDEVTTDGFICTPSVFSEEGTQTVTVQYGSFHSTIEVTVQPAEYAYKLVAPGKTDYIVGDTFDPTGMQLLRRVNNGSWVVYATEGFTCTPGVFTSAGTQNVTVTYGSFSGTVSVDVREQETPPTQALFTVTGGKAAAGETVQVTVDVSNNPGIVAARLSLSYDRSILTLESVQNGDVFGTSAFTKGGDLSAVPFTVLWEDSLNPNHTQNGTLVTFTFRVHDDAEEGTTSVTLAYDADSTYNADLDNVAFLVQNGAVTVQNRLPGDANGDGSVDLKDAAVLRRFLAGGWNVTLIEKNADVNGDGTVTLKDVTLITRYLAGGWGVILI